MRARYLAVLLMLTASAAFALDEVNHTAASVTTTSQMVSLGASSKSVALCSQGTDLTYYRIFTDFGTAAVATSGDIPLPAGTATAPVCHSYTFDSSSALSGTGYMVVAILADSGTATVNIISQ